LTSELPRSAWRPNDSGPGQGHCSGSARAAGGESARLEAKATRIHSLGRLRSKYFFTQIMADSSMDVMLSLFVGELQATAVSEAALAVANLLSPAETDALIDRLVQAGLAVTTGQAPDGRTVGLSPLGSARMRSFINDYPDV